MNIYEIIEKLNIKYEEIVHDAVYTMEEAMKIKKSLEGIECKNLFLKSKDNYFLLVIEGTKKANLKEIEKKFNIKRLTFASEEELMSILNLLQAVSESFLPVYPMRLLFQHLLPDLQR